MAAIIHDVVQGTPEWFGIRTGLMTASHASTIAARGKGLETYCRQIAQEIYGKQRRHFSNEHTRRGHELEPFARQLYEIKTGNKVLQLGFVTNPELSRFVGSSPDGRLAGQNIGQEIKCLILEKHNKFLKTKQAFRDHKWQMQMQMLVEETEAVDYTLYNPHHPSQTLAIKREYPNGAMRETLILGIKEGERLIIKFLQEYGDGHQSVVTF